MTPARDPKQWFIKNIGMLEYWRHLGASGGIWRHLGGIWEAPGRHLGGIWEASGRPGLPRGPQGGLRCLRLKKVVPLSAKIKIFMKTY